MAPHIYLFVIIAGLTCSVDAIIKALFAVTGIQPEYKCGLLIIDILFSAFMVVWACVILAGVTP